MKYKNTKYQGEIRKEQTPISSRIAPDISFRSIWFLLHRKQGVVWFFVRRGRSGPLLAYDTNALARNAIGTYHVFLAHFIVTKTHKPPYWSWVSVGVPMENYAPCRNQSSLLKLEMY